MRRHWMPEDVAQDQNPKFARVNSVLNVFEVVSGYDLSKLHSWTLPWKLKLNLLLLRTRHTGRQQWLTCCCWFVPPYVSLFSPDVWHQKLLEIVQREESKVNWTLSAKVEFLNSEKCLRDRYKPSGTRHFTPFKKDAKKWRENRETWYLIWKAADLGLLKTRNSEYCKHM